MAQLNQSDRPPCGTRKSKLNPTAWTKDELVNAAVSSGLLSKSKAAKASMSALCFLLGLSGAQVVSSAKECGPRKSKAHPSVYTTDELRKLAISRADELDLSKSEIRTLSKDELCNILFSSNIKVSSEQKIPLPVAAVQLPTSESCLVPYNKDIKLREHQIRIVKHLLKHRGIIAIHPVGSGKCHIKGTPILMFDGSIKNVEDIAVGDELMGDDSTPRNVLSIARGKEPCYMIHQETGGENYGVNKSHILSLKISGQKSIHNRKNKGINYITASYFDAEEGKMKSKYFRITSNKPEDSCREEAKQWMDNQPTIESVDLLLEDYLSMPEYIQKFYKGYRVGVDWPEQKTPFDPYFLGIWLGDGNSSGPGITTVDQPILDYLYGAFPDFDFRKAKITYFLTPKENKGKIGCNSIMNRLREHNLIENKHIPHIYKVNSRSNRLKLLAGLIDTDGHLSKGSYYEITQKSKTLADDIVFVSRSLGFRAQVVAVEKTCTNAPGGPKTGTYHRVTISGAKLHEIPCLLERKKCPQTKPNKDQLRNAINVRPLGEQDYYGFELDGNHRYLLGDFTVTHNTLTSVTALNCVLSNYPTVKAIFVAPLSLVENFQKELVKFGLGPDTEAVKKLNLKDRLKLYSKESFFSEIQKAKNANSCKDVFLIIDEAHNYRNSIDMTAAKPKGKISASMINCASQAFKVLLLTATPMKNRESDIINLISMVDGTPLKNAPSVKYFNKVIMNDDNEFARYFKCKFSMLNRVADDPNYPERIDEPHVRLLMTPEFYKKYYAVQEAQSKKYLIDLYGDPKHFKMFYSALRRASLSLDDEKSPKVQWTFEKIVSEAVAGRKSIVYSAWKDSGLFKVRKLLDEAKIPYGMIIGDLSSAQRTFYKNEYNNGKIKILLLSRAGGEGLDLTETRNVILMEPNWNAGDDEQIIGRADRFGSHSKLPPSERNVHVWRLFMIKPLRLRTNPETGKLDSPKSVDQILYDMSYVDKEPKIETMLERLQPLSIENIDCDCYLSTNGNCKLSVPYSSEVKAEAPLIEEVNIDYDMDSKGYEERAKKFKRLKIGGYNPPRVGTSLLAPARRSGLRPRSVKPRAPLKLRRSKSARG
jgi:Hom_end-associated Hint/Helicase conserved C-terminal domain/Homing endonuclease/Type III restriction enzyme, res subunit